METHEDRYEEIAGDLFGGAYESHSVGAYEACPGKACEDRFGVRLVRACGNYFVVPQKDAQED